MMIYIRSLKYLQSNQALDVQMLKQIVIILVVGTLVVGAYLFLTTKPLSDEEFEVEDVIDGDTIRLESGDKVRLIGINTPETGQPYYDEATLKLKELIGDNNVILKKDTEDKDQYGRLLRYVYVDDIFINKEMVRLGLANAYEFEPNVKHSSEFEVAEQEARDAERGLWTPSQFSLTVTQFNYDAEGNDNENLNDEYVVFKNEGNSSLNLLNWLLLDESNNDYVFEDFTLVNGSSFTFYTGSGTDSETKLYWGSENSIWNNAGDTLYLRDAQGFLVAYHSY
jgi:micrococcal nuclease